MANKKLTELSSATGPTGPDELYLVDVSDTTDDPAGSGKSLTLTLLAAWIAALTQTLTNKTLTAPVINSPTGLVKGDVGLGSVSNVAQLPLSYLDTDGTLAANSDVKVASQKATKTYVDANRGVTASESATFSNKRITKRVALVTGATGTITPNADTTDVLDIAALNATGAFQVPSGTPTDSQGLVIRIKDNGTARAISWASATGGYEAGGVDLPTTTVTGKILHVGFMYVTSNSLNKWMCIASAQEV